MEYAQRLSMRKRNVLHTENTPSVGRTLFTRAAAGGAKALHTDGGQIAIGARADLIALSMEHPLLSGKKDNAILDTLIFTDAAAVTDVYVGGRRVIENGVHPLEEKTRLQRS